MGDGGNNFPGESFRYAKSGGQFSRRFSKFSPALQSHLSWSLPFYKQTLKPESELGKYNIQADIAKARMFCLFFWLYPKYFCGAWGSARVYAAIFFFIERFFALKVSGYYKTTCI